MDRQLPILFNRPAPSNIIRRASSVIHSLNGTSTHRVSAFPLQHTHDVREHGFDIDATEKELSNNGFNVSKYDSNTLKIEHPDYDRKAFIRHHPAGDGPGFLDIGYLK